ncbi:MAG: hypothetical protein ACTHK5_05615, partial [Tsuneonella sp.]
MGTINRRVFIARRPLGEPQVDDFSVEEVRLGTLSAGDVLVAVDTLSVDAWIRTTLGEGGLHATGDLGSTIRAF